MKLITKVHGEIEYNKEDIITFEKGISGFDNLKEYIILDLEDGFKVLHSVDNSDVGFVIVNPFDIVPQYEFELMESKKRALNIKDQSDIILYNIITLHSNIEESTINLRSPIVINQRAKLAEQIVLGDERYDIRYPIFKEES